VEEESDESLEEMAERLRAMPKSLYSVRLESIEAEVREQVPASSWSELARYANVLSSEHTAMFQSCVARIRYKLSFPASKDEKIQKLRYYRGLTDLSEQLEGVIATLRSVAFREHEDVFGYTSLWDRFSHCNDRFVTGARVGDKTGNITRESLNDFLPLLEILFSASIRHLEAHPPPATIGRPKFPERDECSRQAVVTWLRTLWSLGIRGEKLLPTKRNNGFRFVTKILDLGFQRVSRSSATIDNIAQSAIANMRTHAISVSDFIEADQKAGRPTTLDAFDFHVRPYEARRRYMASIGIQIPE
jgi:hypothetical protein